MGDGAGERTGGNDEKVCQERVNAEDKKIEIYTHAFQIF